MDLADGSPSGFTLFLSPPAASERDEERHGVADSFGLGTGSWCDGGEMAALRVDERELRVPKKRDAYPQRGHISGDAMKVAPPPGCDGASRR